MLVHPIHYASSFNNFELQRHLAFIYNNRIFRIMYVTHITKIDISYMDYNKYTFMLQVCTSLYRLIISRLKAELEDILQN